MAMLYYQTHSPVVFTMPNRTSIDLTQPVRKPSLSAIIRVNQGTWKILEDANWQGLRPMLRMTTSLTRESHRIDDKKVTPSYNYSCKWKWDEEDLSSLFFPHGNIYLSSPFMKNSILGGRYVLTLPYWSLLCSVHNHRVLSIMFTVSLFLSHSVLGAITIIFGPYVVLWGTEDDAKSESLAIVLMILL